MSTWMVSDVPSWLLLLGLNLLVAGGRANSVFVFDTGGAHVDTGDVGTAETADRGGEGPQLRVA